MNIARPIVQSTIGVFAAVVAFLGGLALCSIIPGTGIKWVNERGQAVVGIVVFSVCLGVGLVRRFQAGSLFISAALITLLLTAIRELSENWHYTALPVGLSAALALCIRFIYEHSRTKKC
jgi:hypothetical protein